MSEKKTQKTSDKKSFVLRIDEETYKLIEKWAADEFRSPFFNEFICSLSVRW